MHGNDDNEDEESGDSERRVRLWWKGSKRVEGETLMGKEVIFRLQCYLAITSPTLMIFWLPLLLRNRKKYQKWKKAGKWRWNKCRKKKKKFQKRLNMNKNNPWKKTLLLLLFSLFLKEQLWLIKSQHSIWVYPRYQYYLSRNTFRLWYINYPTEKK